VAAVDCGTNSTRLLICSSDGATLERRMVITRLGQGVDAHRRLDPQAIGRTVAVLDQFADDLARHGVERVRAAATSAVRDATNGDEFLSAAAAAIGVEPELLSGEEEAALSFAGATADLVDENGPFLVVDIGGGSTEVVVGSEGMPWTAASLDLGCVRLTERFLHSDPPSVQELADAGAQARHLLEQVRVGAADTFAPAKTMLGLAGTVSAAAVLASGADHYDYDLVHHRRLGREVVSDLLVELASMPVAARRRRQGLETERADVIVGGLVILEAVMDTFGFDECLASESDILNGMVASLLGRRPSSPR
jgi:exopolyphosphatase/guanosine-5'-triphosphate,3'-diphosphate pyrophosphatase